MGTRKVVAPNPGVRQRGERKLSAPCPCGSLLLPLTCIGGPRRCPCEVYRLATISLARERFVGMPSWQNPEYPPAKLAAGRMSIQASRDWDSSGKLTCKRKLTNYEYCKT